MSGEGKTRRRLPQPTQRLSLGHHLKVSPFLVSAPADPQVAAEALEAGINFFMLTADLFWERDAALRAGLARVIKARGRDAVVVLGLSYVADPALASEALRELASSVKGLERLDVVGAGSVGGADLGPRMLGLRTISAGSVMAASFSDPAFTAVCMEARLVDLALVRYNALDDTAATRVLPFVRERAGAVLFGAEALGGFESPEELDALGVDPLNWRPTRYDHYRFVLSAPQVHGVVVAGLRPGEMPRLVSALKAGPLDEPSRAYLVRTAHADPRARTGSES